MNSPRVAGCNRSDTVTSLSENTGLQFTLSPRWHHPPVSRGMRYLQESLAVLAALAILLAFFHVVQGSVRQGNELRAAMAAHSAATYQCNALASTGAADICRQQLNAPTIPSHSPTLVLVSAATRPK
jgi:hypothetical protein